ncbi:UNVERIFIED_CONTAM: stage III sporulation protein AB [Acetivibrio alkalicellulosi]
MAVKIFGSLIVLLSCTLLGYIHSKKCSKRPGQLRVLQGMLQIFENEICFLSNKLIDAFLKINRGSDNEVSLFFESTVDNLKNNSGFSASEAWSKSVRDNIKYTSLNKEDEEIIVSFGKMLGNSDLEGQIKNIRLTLNQLKIQEQKAEEFRKKNETMYRNLGILGGLAIIIILF